MKRLAENLQTLLNLISESESKGYIKEADVAHKALLKIAQQAQGNAYNNLDTSQVPPAIATLISNLNYKITQLDNTQKQMAQQLGGGGQQPAQNDVLQQLDTSTQNTVTPTTVNYIQTPGSTPAPIEMDGGQINV